VVFVFSFLSKVVEICSSYQIYPNIPGNQSPYRLVCQALPTVDELAKLEEQIKERSNGCTKMSENTVDGFEILLTS